MYFKVEQENFANNAVFNLNLSKIKTHVVHEITHFFFFCRREVIVELVVQ